MAVYEIRGEKYEIPDDVSGEQLQSVLSGIGENQSNSFGVNLVRQINQGLTLGFGDEIEAGINAVGAAIRGDNIEEAYNSNINTIRSQRQQFQAESPATAIAAELAGGIGAGAVGGVKLAAQIPQRFGQAARAAATAAPAGAIAGAGASDPSTDAGFLESLSDRLEGALKGGLIGGIFGAGVPAAVQSGKNIVESGAAKIRGEFVGAKSKSLRKIAEAMERDGLSLTDVMRKKALSGPQATLADVGGDNTQQLLDAIANQPGHGVNRVKKALIGRLQGQRTRIKDSIRGFVHPEAENLLEARGAIESAMKQKAQPIYHSALSSKIDITPDIKNILDRPKIKPLIKKAITSAQSDTDLPTDLVSGLDADNPNMVVLDYVKKSIDDRIRKTVGNERRIFTSAKNKLVSFIDDQVPDYGKARKVWADDAKRIEALELGQDIFKEAKKGALNVEKTFNSMSVSEQEMFKLGAANEMFRLMDNVGDTLEGRPSASLLKKIYDTPAQKQAINAILENPRMVRQFERMLKSEKNFIEISNRTLSNSSTSKRLANQADLSMDVSDAAEIAQGRVGGIFNILNKIAKGAGPNEKTRNELSKLLTTSDSDDIKNILLNAKRQGSLLPASIEKALDLDKNSFAKWVRKNSDKVIPALSTATGITAGIEAQ